MDINKLRKAVFLIIGLSLFFGLSGCKRTAVPVNHTLSDIKALSISSGNADRRYGYSFWVHKEEHDWFLNVSCFLPEQETETTFENYELSNQDIEAIFDILEQNESISYVENYKQPQKTLFSVMDEITYGFCLTFSDGTQSLSHDRQYDLEGFFYRLVENITKNKK